MLANPPVGAKTVMPMQFFGIGDVIFCITLARRYWLPHAEVVWPVMPHYVEGLNRAYPDIRFVDYSTVDCNWNDKTERMVGDTFITPLRWSYEITNVPFKDCMKSKYGMYSLDWRQWKDLAQWNRDETKEMELFNIVNPTNQPFNLSNKYFRCDSSGHIARINIPSTAFRLPIIEMKTIEGYSIFDWALVMEKASQIHTVSTSIIYLLEILKLRAHIYIRRPDERSHANYDYLLEQSHNLKF